MAEENPTAPAGEQPGQRVSRGRWLAVFGLLVALSSVCGVAYLYYTLVLLNPAARVAERITALQAADSGFAAELQRLAGERQTALDALRAEAAERQQASEDRLAATLGRLSRPDPPSERDWRLAEVEYLLRTANHGALLERDARTALHLLKAADGILGQLDDFATHDVRGTLAAEILSLERAGADDPSGIYFRLDAIKRRLTALTLALPEYAPGDPAPAAEPTSEPTAEIQAGPAAKPGQEEGGPAEAPVAAGEHRLGSSPSFPSAQAATAADDSAAAPVGTAGEEPGLFDSLLGELGKLVRFRRIDTGLERPPAPAESDHLELNLRLMLEQAQLAALRRNQAVYASSLDSALAWARALLDGQDAGVQEVIDSLEKVRRQDLDRPLPDISGSLNELLEARREGS